MENYTSDVKIKQEVTEESVCESEGCSLVEPGLKCKVEIEENEPYATDLSNNVENVVEGTEESLAAVFQKTQALKKSVWQKTSSRSKCIANSIKYNRVQDVVTDLVLVREKVDSGLIQKQLEIRRTPKQKRTQIEFVSLVEENNLTFIPEETELNAKMYAKRNRAQTSKKPPSYRQLKIKLPNTRSPDKQQKVKKQIKFDEPPKRTSKNIKDAQLPTNEGINTKRSRINNTTGENQNKDKHSPTEPTQDSNVAISNEDINLQNLYQSDSDELDDLQDFPAPVLQHKLPRRKPQFTEEQLAEKKRKFMERRTCTICGAVFAFTGGLRNHIRSKHTFEKLYTCDFCAEKFIVQSTYLLHRQRHLGIRPHLCNLCGKTFLRRIDMNIHMRIHIPYKDKIRDVKCNFCPKVYTSKTNLRKHTLSKHTDPSEWKHECHMCGKKLYSGTALTHHIRHHNDDRRYKCVICGRGFFTKQTMDIHVRTHTANTPFNCVHCSKGYRSNEALQRHLVKVHGIGEEKPTSAPTYFCPVCNAGFRYKSRLEQHMEVHETGKEEYPYECEKCQRRYKARHYFTIHMLERHGIKIDESYFKTFLAVSHENRTNISIIDYQNLASGDDTKNMEHKISDASYIDPDEPDL